MSTPIIEFMRYVLGEDGERAFAKANQRAPSLGAALAPRTIIGWLSTAVRVNYEGEIPGLPNSYMALKKSEDGFSGALTISNQVHSFQKSDLLEVAASVAVALGLEDVAIDPLVKSTDISKLGKSIDMLVKARIIAKAMANDIQKKILSPDHGYQFSHEHHDLGGGNMMTKVHVHSADGEHVGAATFTHGPGHITPGSVVVDEDHQRRGVASAMYAHAEKHTGKKIRQSSNQTPEGAALWAGNKKQPQFGKNELPGSAAKPKGPKLPDAPDMPVATPPSTNKKTARPQPQVHKRELAVTKSESGRACAECGLHQFRQEKFVGCMCWRSLAKSITTTVQSDGYRLTMSRAQWDDDTVEALIQALKG